MNEFQEALDRLKDTQSNLIALNSRNRLNTQRTNDLKVVLESTDKLQELVDKETPMKPIYIQGFSTNRKKVKLPLCGKCSINLVVDYVKLRRCINDKCNQVVDWSDEE